MSATVSFFLRCVAAAWIAVALLPSFGRAARAGRDRPPPRRFAAAPQNLRASEGRVVEVRRASRELTVRTSRGAIERIVVPAQAAIRAPHGSKGLSGVHAGMVVRLEGKADERGRIVARELAAH